MFNKSVMVDRNILNDNELPICIRMSIGVSSENIDTTKNKCVMIRHVCSKANLSLKYLCLSQDCC